uniref:Peroxisomal sarcosine oxidase-like n=2 Tax=Ciona intestinalis TaxID=7719 RepID=F6QJA2_CIOIN
SFFTFTQYQRSHTRGSSHGQSRIIRKLYVDQHHAQLMDEAYQLWNELQTSSGIDFFKINGHIAVCKKSVGKIKKLVASCEKYGIEHKVLDGSHVNAEFPGLKFNDDFEAVYEQTGGVLNADKCLQAIQEELIKFGGELHENEKVLNIEPINASRVNVQTSTAEYDSASVVLCCGSWTNKLLKPLDLQLPLKACKVQVTYWKEKVPNIYSKFPSLIYYKVDAVSMYGLPCEAYPGYFKFCFHYHFVVDPDDEEDLEKHPSSEEAKMRMEEIKEVVKNHLPYLVPEPKVKEPCMLTTTPDTDYILDRHPRHKNI